MSGTGPLLDPPALKRLSPPEVAAGLGELAEGDGEDVVVVGAGEAVVVVGAGEAVVGVVVCCASTVGGASHATRTAKTVKITRATMMNHNKTCIRSVTSTLGSVQARPRLASLTSSRHSSRRSWRAGASKGIFSLVSSSGKSA
jgi:hypothetical protein